MSPQVDKSNPGPKAATKVARVKSHNVFEDMCKHPDHSWYIQPLGFILSIVLFPSYAICGLATTIQESALLDLKFALDHSQHDFVSARYNRLVRDIAFQTEHMKVVCAFITKMSKSLFIKSLSGSEDEEELLKVTLIYYKRYTTTAIGKELYIRNPLKYDYEYPVAGVIAKVTITGLSTVAMLFKLAPAVETFSEAAMTTNSADKFMLSKSSIVQGLAAVKKHVTTRWSWGVHVMKNRRGYSALFLGINIANIVMWGAEERK